MPEVAKYISEYGYAAILVIIVLQEIGVPNPVPVELLVFFTGYLSYKGLLYLPYVIITAMTADLAGAVILYFIFYTSGIFLIDKKPRWFPVSEKKITQLKERINNGGWRSIYLFRLVSITRGYAAVISGLLHLNLRTYLLTVVFAAVSWTLAYALLGFILGHTWIRIFNNAGHFRIVILGILLIIIFISVFLWSRRKQTINKKETSGF